MTAQEGGELGIALDQGQPLRRDARGQQRLGDLAGAGAQFDDMARPAFDDGAAWSRAMASASRRPLGITAPIAKGRRSQRFRKRAVPAGSTEGMAER